MSEWGAVIEQLESIARAQFPGLRPSLAGFERSIRPVESLTDAEIPHVFAHNPAERVEKLDYGQESVEFSIELLYVPEKSTTQESLAVLLDNFRAVLQTNPTLGGVCERAWVRERGVREHESRELRAGVIEVVAEWVQ